MQNRDAQCRKSPQLAIFFAGLTLSTLACWPLAAEQRIHGPCGGADEVAIREEGAAIVFTYTNDAEGTSSPCTHEVQVGDHTIRLRIYINVSGTMSERFEVTPPDGYMAIPEFIDVEDGVEGDVTVLPMMF